MTKLKEFTLPNPKPMPVIILADTSGSMKVNGKIDALNGALKDMISSLVGEQVTGVDIHLAVVTFGGGQAQLHQAIKPISEVTWTPMEAAGKTPLGKAIELVSEMIEDRSIIPGRAYRPVIILVSDGLATDDWRGPMQRLLSSDRASKADRFAMGIGDDLDMDMLKEFLSMPRGKVFQAHEARDINKFFKWVTMSITSRSRSFDPNAVQEYEEDEYDRIDY